MCARKRANRQAFARSFERAFSDELTYNDDQNVANRNNGRGQGSDDLACAPQARENPYDAECAEKAQGTDDSHVQTRNERECGDGHDHKVEDVKGIAPALVCMEEHTHVSVRACQRR